ncbi:anti-repressor SinI family protein [Priestia aryabhattai]|uniref:Anti-repressor SinI family protein n=1 Tax=Priestia aryabhattai TaxID=412384 RepID=A0AAX6ND55_PRIAR|nr:anti-repressor SinI family protein [Priestia aryabhattai]MDU9693424.1 anti-repressor SinI family protein [Priestia aryabhattai]
MCVSSQKLDPEWIELMLEAKRIGVTKEEIKRFIHSQV